MATDSSRPVDPSRAIVPVNPPQMEKKDDKAANAKKSAAKKIPLPFPIELALSFSTGLLVVVAVLVMALSWLAGVSPLMIAVRTAAAILVLGLLLWFLSWVVIRSMMEQLAAEVIKREEEEKAAREKLEAQRKAQQEPLATMEFNA